MLTNFSALDPENAARIRTAFLYAVQNALMIRSEDMVFAAVTAGLCLVFWGLCYLGTGTDEKNLKGLSACPDAVQKLVKADPVLGPKVRTGSAFTSFCTASGQADSPFRFFSSVPVPR